MSRGIIILDNGAAFAVSSYEAARDLLFEAFKRELGLIELTEANGIPAIINVNHIVAIEEES